MYKTTLFKSYLNIIERLFAEKTFIRNFAKIKNHELKPKLKSEFTAWVIFGFYCLASGKKYHTF